MPPSTIKPLPPEVIAEIERRLLDRSLGGYTELAEWLNSQGFTISRSAIARYGKDFKDRCERIRDAKDLALAIAEEVPVEDTERENNTLNAVGRAFLLEFTFRMMEGMDQLGSKDLISAMGTVARSLEAINRTDIAVAKYAAELKAKQEAALSDLEAKATGKTLTPEYLAMVRSQILGMGPPPVTTEAHHP